MPSSNPLSSQRKRPLWGFALVALLPLALAGCPQQGVKNAMDSASFSRLVGDAILPRFNASGTALTFTHAVQGRLLDYEVGIYDLQTQELVRVTANRVYDGESDWSPDGKTVAFVRGTAKVTEGDIWFYHLNTQKEEQVTTLGGASPCWHPTEPLLAFSGSRGGDEEVYVLNLRNGRISNLTTNPARDRQPRWSRDGKSLAFVSDRAGTDDVWVIRYTTLEIFRITSGTGSERYPSWSEDGSELVFSADGLGIPPSPPHQEPRVDLFRVDVKDPANPGTPAPVFPLKDGNFQDLHPDWSPKGRQILFSTNVNSLGWDVMSFAFEALPHANPS